MSPRTLAGLQAAGRLAIGATLVVAPQLLGGGWVGSAADRRSGQVLAIGLGARDVALAVGTLQALGARQGATAWLRAGIAADLADLVSTFRARDELSPPAVPATVAIAGGSALLGAWLQASVE